MCYSPGFLATLHSTSNARNRAAYRIINTHVAKKHQYAISDSNKLPEKIGQTEIDDNGRPVQPML